MGIRAGAEMTTFEMRFIALRCKDTIAPTGTIAQGVGAKQVNAKGEVYEDKYGLTTSERVYGTVMENLEGRGPCYLRTEGITAEQDESLKKAYLNMAPSQTLKWLESGKIRVSRMSKSRALSLISSVAIQRAATGLIPTERLRFMVCLPQEMWQADVRRNM